MWIRPNPSSGLPVYLQLIAQVKHDLQTGALRPGEVLPGISRLATDLVVNPNAVERAYRTLEREGLIDLHGDAGVLRARALSSLPPPRTDATAGARELEAARDVQRRLLPQECPGIPGLDYAGFSRPALAVGGDYYDFIRLSETQLAIAIGDICGKGIPAALLMATLRAFLRGQTLHRLTRPLEVVRTLNRLLCDSFASNRFATFFYGVLDTSTRSLSYVNAGHLPPLVSRRSPRHTLLRLRTGGPVVGLFQECDYEKGHLTLEPDDVIVAFTDGVSEAMNEAGDEWGDEALTQIVQDGHGAAPRELIDRIDRGADAFAAGTPQHDDQTLIAMRFTGCRDDVSV
jgi:phosphoserine phosphatase RsbU/P